jgi:acyl-CoA hydrolase/GNAT superfamily N-acetyltransferase
MMAASASTASTTDPGWQETFKSLITTAEKSVAGIRRGQRVFIGSGCAQPQELVRALTARSDELTDTEIISLLTVGEAPYALERLARHFRVNTFFVTANVRDVVQEGLGSYTPIFFSDIPELFSSGRLPLDVALIQVTPPDKRGMCSLGVSVDVVKSAAENAGLVIAQVNPQMPRTLGDSEISAYDFDWLVPTDVPLIETHGDPPTEISREIGSYVAGLVEDGSTIELGIGRIPHAVLEFLQDKKDIGVHTEMCSDAIIDLVESGVITGARKTLDRGKIVTSFVMGSRRLYDYVDGNPVFSFRPTEYVNDPAVIAQQPGMVAINSALEVDLTGQVCADSIGTRFYSGIGGQVDFVRGAARSHGGKAITALPSTADEGRASRIVARLTSGAGVVTTRGDTQYVVTEYGVAFLHGKTVQERALALIGLAHPDFRVQLLRDAIEARYVSPGLADVEGRISVGPPELHTTMLLPDGTQIDFRPIHPTDMEAFKDLFYALSKETVFYRFMSRLDTLPEKRIQDFVFLDHRTEVCIVGTLREAYGEEIICTGRYYLDPKTNRAEVAFVERDQWQGKGIGTFMFRWLATIARSNGIAGFTAEVLRENKRMQNVFNHSEYRVTSRPEDNVYHFEISF